jgi:hypothetical protein
MNNNRTQAEQFRMNNGEIYEANGWTGERLKYVPTRYGEAEQHPESNSIAYGYIFPDGSEIWEIVNNNSTTLYTVRP